jgi:hypothetical protein
MGSSAPSVLDLQAVALLLGRLKRVAFGWSRSSAFGGRPRAVLGFLGPTAFRREGPHSWGLDCLGFPWILSSASRLFNGLRGMGGGDCSRALPLAERPRNGARVLWPTRKMGLVMGESVTRLPFFRKRLSSPPFAFSRLNPKATRASKPTFMSPTYLFSGEGAKGVFADALPPGLMVVHGFWPPPKNT